MSSFSTMAFLLAICNAALPGLVSHWAHRWGPLHPSHSSGQLAQKQWVARHSSEQLARKSPLGRPLVQPARKLLLGQLLVQPVRKSLLAQPLVQPVRKLQVREEQHHVVQGAPRWLPACPLALLGQRLVVVAAPPLVLLLAPRRDHLALEEQHPEMLHKGQLPLEMLSSNLLHGNSSSHRSSNNMLAADPSCLERLVEAPGGQAEMASRHRPAATSLAHRNRLPALVRVLAASSPEALPLDSVRHL